METPVEHTKTSNLYYPPGGILIWFLMILEIFTFLGAVLIFLYYRKIDSEAFTSYQQAINPILGTINTIVLISSGYLIANAVSMIKQGLNQKASLFLLSGTSLGVIFLLIKTFEFYAKANAGFTFDYNTFFTLYWLMTGFHFVHVLFGVGLLFYMYIAVKKNKYTAENSTDLEASATYWHMCDLIWIFIFPILYLL